MTRYEMKGRPLGTPLEPLLVNQGIGSTFDATYDKDTERQLIACGALKVVEQAKPADKKPEAEKSEAKEKSDATSEAAPAKTSSGSGAKAGGAKSRD